jgi:aryl-alcohol dehydrogenase-like predicted oxidoreductase
MGTMVCSTDNMELTNALLDAYVEAGGNCLDTARVYGGGKTEAALGQWFTSRKNRSEILLLAKGAHPDASGKRVNPKGIAEDIAISLELMQTDYIDIYLLHRDDPQVPVGVIVDALNTHKEAGRIKVFGGSNWTTERIREANDYAKKQGVQGFCASSPQLSLAVPKEAMWGGCTYVTPTDAAWHTQNQSPLFPWSSQASGFFTGRYSPENTSNADMVRVYYNEANWERYRRAEALAAQKGATANQIALAWVLHQPYPTFPLVGPRTLEELATTLPAQEITLTEQERLWLNLEE